MVQQIDMGANSRIKGVFYQEYSKDPTNLCEIGQEISTAIPNCSFTAISKSHDGIHMCFTTDNTVQLGSNDILNVTKNIFKDYLDNLNVPMNENSLNGSFKVLRLPSSFTIII